MGIARLASTLEPYAKHVVLQDEKAVVDGPALAYHLLYKCRANDVVQPSYQLLGECVISWLDEMSSHNIDM